MRLMLLLGVSLVMSLSLIFVNIPTSEAAKSIGNPLTEVSSDKVCGIMLCEEGMTIEEKISSFMNQIPLRGNPDLCKPELELAFRTSDNSPVCVKPETLRMVDELSWLTR